MNAPPSDQKGMPGQPNDSFMTNQAVSTPITQLNTDMSSLSRRIRMLEERYYNLRKKTQLTDQNMLEDNKKITTHMDYFKTSIKEVKKKVADITEKLSMFDEEMKDTAKKRDITLINKYLEFWEPMVFLTEKDAIKLIGDTLDEVGLKKK